MSTIIPYCSFRIKQIGRFLNSVGVGYILVILVLLSGLILQGLSNLMLLDDVVILAGFGLLLIGMFFQRRDTDFLKSTELNLFGAFSVDAFLIGLPLSILLFALSKWQAGLGIYAICFIVAFIRSIMDSLLSDGLEFKKIGLYFSLLPTKDFELNFLWRQFLLFLLPIYIITLIFAWHLASIFVLSFIVLLLLQSILEYYEPKEMIFKIKNSSSFLLTKVFRMFFWFSLSLFPFYAVGLYNNNSQWYLYLMIFVATFLMIAFSVFNKYVFYRPRNYRTKTNALAAIMLLFMFIPGFQLIVLFMSIIQFFKAKKNLNHYR